MLILPEELTQGFDRFRKGSYAEQRDIYDKLAKGQSPHTLVIACSDSRVDPNTIFNAGPGELFIVRNVANLVPKSMPDGQHHGTSAALEYAVENLKVKNIVVMGHGDCGGIKAHLKRAGGTKLSAFIDIWLNLLDDVLAHVQKENPDVELDDLCGHMELSSVQFSLQNMRSFDFVKKAEERGDLKLYGAWFSVMTGNLMALNEEDGQFHKVS